MVSPQEVPLTYTIAEATPHSGRYTCENILVDNPSDQNSRWSGAYQGNTKQWLLLRLESLAVLRRIIFGKFSKPHPCNMKEFKIYIGMTKDNMVQVFHGGLKNSADPETFEIKHLNSMGIVVPTRYVKIEPIAAHGQSFHISIWYVAMGGYVDSAYMDQVRLTYEEQRERIVMRHILKHLRQRRLLSPFKSIVERSGLRLEHPLISKLHESIVLKGDWAIAEQLLSSLSDYGLFTDYLQSCQPQAFWTRITGTDADGDVPSPRGGHAMCIDSENEIVYLFGGWDGHKSLDDFWAYHVREDKWKLLSASTSKEPNAPGARSCHKMVYDSKTGSIYLLGRLDDSDVKPPHPTQPHQHLHVPPNMMSSVVQQSPLRQQLTPPDSQNATPMMAPTKTYCSEFYRYQTRGLDTGKWVFLSFDTAASGGPPLVFDHQMVIDSESQVIYVFGGRVVDGEWETAKFSGLYSYNIRLSKWKLLQAADASNTSQNAILPRFGHSMVLEPRSKQLYIFGGQREQRYLSDMYVYDISTGTTTELFSNFSTSGGPDPCFTQRAVIDPLLKEIYVFCGLTRSSTSASQNTALKTNPSNWVYRYSPRPGKWTQITRHPDSSPKDVPLPRFAHQVVYHPGSRTVFLHGGNAGGVTMFEKDKEGAATNGNGNADGNGSGNGSGGSNQDGTPMPTTRNLLGVDGSTTGNNLQTGTSTQVAPAVTKEMRLDDFWKMELRRPQVSEIIRRAKFHIRRQQFREMSEETMPVRALQFLQTEVSSVVDHKNPEETDAFRALLTHLLAPSSRSAHLSLPPSAAMHSSTRSPSQLSAISDASQVSSSGESAGRRSRRLSEESGTWTNVLPGEEERDDDTARYATGVPSSGMLGFRGTADMLRGIVDPLELSYDTGPEHHSHLKPVTLTSDRYHQRTEVFSSILEYVSLEEKEPEGDLLDLVMGRDVLFSGDVLPGLSMV